MQRVCDLANVTSIVRDAGTGRLNQTTSYAYNSTGDVTSVTDPRGNVTTNVYDAVRRLVTSTQPTASSGANGVTTTLTYDADNRVLQSQQSFGGTVLRTTSTTYTVTGKPATTTDANGNVTTFAYDTLDRRVSVTDAMKRVTLYGYDVLSRIASVSNPAIQLGPLARQTFTADGLRASLIDANGNTTVFAYDGFDRLSISTYPDTSTETLGYDADSNITSRGTRASQSIAYTYDTLNRLTAKTPPSPWPAVAYSYDLAGRLTGVSDTSVSIAAAVPPGGAASVLYATSYSYDAMNRPTGVVFGPVPAATPPSSASSILFGHSFNAVNQRIGQTVSDNRWIAYPTATTLTSYTANSLNQYTAVGGIAPTYDANGNLAADGTNSYGYDAENRLVTMSGGGNTASYVFDGRGRRKNRSVNGSSTVSVTDADNREVLEYDGGTGAPLRWYAYGLGPNQVLSQTNVNSSTRLALIPDTLGSVIALQDAGTGALTPFSYHPYGYSNSPPPQFGYTGQRVDQESGLYYYRARHYHPAWGRFLQTDPFAGAAASLLYAYTTNDPVNRIDPTGLWGDVYVEGNQVSIRLPIVFNGSGLTPERQIAITAGIQNRWTGQFGRYSVITLVVPPSPSAPLSQIDTITVLDRPGISVTNTVGGNQVILFTSYPGCDPSDFNDLGSRAAHEAGHLLGVDEAYNKATGLSLPGRTGDIMATTDRNLQTGEYPMATEADIADVIRCSNNNCYRTVTIFFGGSGQNVPGPASAREPSGSPSK